LAQQFEPALSALREACRAQRDADRAWGTERPGERDLLGCEHSSLGLFAERESREGSVRAPRSSCRTWASQSEEEVTDGEEIVERQGWAKLGEAKAAARRQQKPGLQRRRELLGQAVALVGCFGGLELSPLGERPEQGGECGGGVDAGWPGSRLERDAGVGLGVGQVTCEEMREGAVAAEPEHVGKRAQPASIGYRVVESRAGAVAAPDLALRGEGALGP
jgi:hypothetical protein